MSKIREELKAVMSMEELETMLKGLKYNDDMDELRKIQWSADETLDNLNYSYCDKCEQYLEKEEFDVDIDICKECNND